jgi:5-methylcytosine-specific restriction endonuclease McrA
MSASKTPDQDRLNKIVEEGLRDKAEREKGYREKALKLFPWICGRCGREFSGKKLKELTVHHKDHNHDNNPPDGSNWELLCIYCHDNEHGRDEVAEAYGTEGPTRDSGPSTTFKAFAGLEALLKNKK